MNVSRLYEASNKGFQSSEYQGGTYYEFRKKVVVCQ